MKIKTLITILLLISLLLPTRAAVGFEEEAPTLSAAIIDADTGEDVKIGTKNILVTVDIPTYIFEEEGEKPKVDLRVERGGEEVFKREGGDSSSPPSATQNDGEGRTKTEYLFSLDSPLEEGDDIEMCFTVQPSGRGGCGAFTIEDGRDLKVATPSATPGRDISELMLGMTTEAIEPGDLVAISHEKNSYGIPIVRTSQVYQKGLIGVVSTNPVGITLGAGLPETDDYKPFPLALTGTVPVNVSAENGPIEPGDPITSSSVPGVGMKATLPGPIIGKALESFTADDADSGGLSGNGTILVIISLGWYPGDAILYEGLADRLENLESQLDGLGLVNVSLSESDFNSSLLNSDSTNNATSTLVYDADAGETMSSGENLLNSPTTLDSSGNIVMDNPISNIQYLTSNLNMSGFGIFNVGRIAGIEGKWSIDEEGDIVTEGGIYAKEDIQTEGIFASIIRVAKSLLGRSETLVVENRNPISTGVLRSDFNATSTPQDVYSWFEGNAAEASRLDVFGEDEDTVSFMTYSMSSSRSEVMVSGSGILNRDLKVATPSASTESEVSATIVFDPSFTAIISEEEPIRVIVTPTSRINGSLYVAQKSIYGFVVKELHSQDEGAKFDWVVIARRKGFEENRGLKSATPENDIPMLPVEPASSADEPASSAGEPETIIDSTAIPGDNSFSFHCVIDGVQRSDCSFQCRVNNQGFVPCESPKNYGVLLPGEYIFKVYAVAPDGKYDHSPAEFEWVIEENRDLNVATPDSGGGDNATSTPAQ